MFLRKTLVAVVACAALVTGVASTASADTRYVDYLIREDPSDPESDVIYIFSLGIEEAETDGDWIGWQIDEVAIVRLDSLGEVDAYWTESAPYVPTSDGLWWVQHEDTENPKGKEFDVTPWLVGTALADDPNDDDMRYDFIGATYTGQGPQYGGSVSGMAYVLAPEGEEEPEAEGHDEAAQVEDPDWGPVYE
jgi:hypothetical protein